MEFTTYFPTTLGADPRCCPLPNQKPLTQNFQVPQYPNQNPMLYHYNPTPPQIDYKPPYQITNSFPETKPDVPRRLRKEELIYREESLLNIDNPDALCKAFMKLRRWDYCYSIEKLGFGYQVTIKVCDETIFKTYSRYESKARIKAIISVLYNYDSFLVLKWLSKHQDFLATKINKF